MKPKRWMIAEPDAGGVRRLTQEIHCAPLAAAVLSARGLETPMRHVRFSAATGAACTTRI